MYEYTVHAIDPPLQLQAGDFIGLHNCPVSTESVGIARLLLSLILNDGPPDESFLNFEDIEGLPLVHLN